MARRSQQIRTSVAALPSPFLDRPAIEKLFGVKRRQANNLMRGLGGYRIGHAALVGREDLLLKLDQMAGPRGYLAQIERKSRVVETLDALRSEARPRRVSPPPLAAPAPLFRPAPASRPQGS